MCNCSYKRYFACSRLFLCCLRGSVSLLRSVFFSLLLISQVLAATDSEVENAKLESLDRPLVVLVPPDVLAQYHLYLAGRSPLDIGNFSEGGASRVLVELILLHQALVLGGCKRDIELQPVGDYRRMLALLNEGKADLRGLSVWREDVAVVPNGLLLSAPLFRDGEYEAGFYTSADNKQALKTTSLHQLKRLSAVSNNNWTVDWRTLESMGLSYLYHNGSYLAMVKMVFSERADFMLAPFPEGADLTLKLKGLTLEPIPGIKVALQGSRHWVASRRGAKAFDALEKGLAQLRAGGMLKKAFVEAGIFNPAVHEWDIVNR